MFFFSFKEFKLINPISVASTDKVFLTLEIVLVLYKIPLLSYYIHLKFSTYI